MGEVMNDTQIKQFIELARCLNFTKAAQNLYIAQPALSRSIAKMEKELGLGLFIRNKKNVRLTPAGIVMMKGYEKLLKDHSNLLEEAIKVDKGESGYLNVGIIECQNTEFYLPQIIKFLYENYKGIQIEIHYDNFKGLRSKFDTGDIDIAITQLFDLNSYQNYDIVYETFAETPGRCIVSRQHTLGRYEEFEASNFDGEVLIVISPEVSSQGYDDAINYLKYNNIKVGGIKTASTLQDITLLVESGLGFAFWDCNSKINTNCVKLLPIKDHHRMLSLVAVWKRENYNTAIPIFIECLLKRTDNIFKKLV